jgi:hypothetical protein
MENLFMGLEDKKKKIGLQKTGITKVYPVQHTAVMHGTANNERSRMRKVSICVACDGRNPRQALIYRKP